MGNLCGKPSSSSSSSTPDPFAQPGRIVGSTPSTTTNARSSLPPKISSQSPGRPLGGSTAAPSSSAEGSSDARQAAAKAAQERAARANQPKGKLGRELAKEKQQTRTSTLGEVSREERRRRDADEGAVARNWS